MSSSWVRVVLGSVAMEADGEPEMKEEEEENGERMGGI